MSFQVLISIFKRNLSSIESITVPDGLTLICQLYVTLEAVMQGDLTGHTFEWEQISGTPVSWIGSRFQQTVTFSQIAGSDKVFKFWVDRGTTLERFRTMTLYGTPASTATMMLGSSGSESNMWLSSEEAQSFLLIPGDPVVNEVPNSIITGNTPEGLSWSTPGAGKTLVQSVVEEKTGQQFVPIATIIPPSPLRYSGISATKSYRIRNTFVIGGVTTTSVTQTYRPVAKSYLYGSGLDKYDMMLSAGSEGSYTVTYTSRQLVSFGPTSPDVIDTANVFVSSSGSNEFNKTLTSRQLVSFGPTSPNVIDTANVFVSGSSNWEFNKTVIARQNSSVGGG